MCSYAWQEAGSSAGTPVEWAILASDVLRLEGGSWVHLARHESIGHPS